jgi:hypothetical protein
MQLGGPRERLEMKVRVIRRKGHGVLVEWRDEEGYHRAVVPTGAVDGDFCDPQELAMGIPYGEPWAQIMGDLVITGERLEDELRKHGIWTIEDARQKPNDVAGALLAVHRMGVDTLIGRAVAAKRAEMGPSDAELVLGGPRQ